MSYIDGFVAAVPAANKEAYRKHAAEAAPLFKEFGATRLVETWGDDVPDGKVTDFRGAVKAKDGEVIVFSWLEYPSKDVRDAANEKMISDPRMEQAGADMPFDGQRMIYGGFKLINDVGAAEEPGYVDGFLAPVLTASEQAYREFATEVAALFQEYGATRVADYWGDDVPDDKVTDYRGAVKTQDGETVAYGWIEWPSKAVRDEAWKKLESEPRMQQMSMPFDGQRMVFGGFAPIVDA